jgi:putative transposase
MSPSSVYRILKEFNLLSVRGKRDRTGDWNAHQKLTGPDQIWQTDLMNIRYHGRDFYLLTYFDVYSRYVVYQTLCTSMTGDTIQEISERALAEAGKKPEIIQSDNGSCYISCEYRSFASKNKIMHRFIHPHCPNENSEIERYHRTMRESADISSADDFLQLELILKEQKSYYNNKRYHSAIGFVTPYSKYIGQADKILAERKKKLEKAQDKRFKENYDIMKLLNADKKVA